ANWSLGFYERGAHRVNESAPFSLHLMAKGEELPSQTIDSILRGRCQTFASDAGECALDRPEILRRIQERLMSIPTCSDICKSCLAYDGQNAAGTIPFAACQGRFFVARGSRHMFIHQIIQKSGSQKKFATAPLPKLLDAPDALNEAR